MDNLPGYITIVFGLTVLLSVFLFDKAAGNSRVTLIAISGWIVIQSIIGLSGFYTKTNTFPPRLMLLAIIPFLVIIVLFSTAKGKRYLDRLDVKMLTILHIVRIPVEIVLFWLFVRKAIPALMTFEGRNFDILAGLSAPVIYYFGYVKKNIKSRLILIWNIICLGLLINILVNAVLSAPFPFQQFAFDQPNIAILYFPFNLLPTFVVPLVLLAHLAAIRQLISGHPGNTT
jgi:hypothetical protein